MSDDLTPPARLAGESFDTYRPQTPSQEQALHDARALAGQIRRRYTVPRWRRWLRRHHDRALRGGLYLVGPVGTGKTHLLVSIYRALEPDVPCAFLHSSRLFRATEHPEEYAARLARRYRVLLIDEVELDDPANEVRLIVVLKALHRLGVTVAATSNAEPDKFVSAKFGRDRLERFISEEFKRTYHVVFVGGEDFRRGLEKPGRAWVGPLDAADAAMRARYEQDRSRKRWLEHGDLLRLATTTERTRLAHDLGALERLYIAGIRVRNADDALRLLRVVDDLYDQPQPPVIFFTADRQPGEWFRPENAHVGVEAAVAEKFARTVSRLHAMCAIERVGREAGVEG
jgi:cell division protein ZapE